MKRALSSYREDENNSLVFFFINIKIIVKKNDIKSICHMLDKKLISSFHFHFSDPNETFKKLVSLSQWKVTVYSILPRARGYISSFSHTGT